MQTLFFPIPDKAKDILSKQDPLLGRVILDMDTPLRTCIPDFFQAFAYSIAGQQISGKAHLTIWQRVCAVCEDTITPKRILAESDDTLRSCGLSMRKIRYIKECAAHILDGSFSPKALSDMEDEAVIRLLCTLSGVGRWTAEMLLIFCLMRPDVVSFGDLGIVRGMRMLYQKERITKELFLTYRSLYSPFGTIASFYLWEIAGGAVSFLVDPAQQS